MQQRRVLDAIISVCGEILGDEEILDSDNFFALGGTSLDAIALTEMLSSRYGIEVSLDSVFEAEDIFSLSILCSESRAAEF